MPFLFCIEEEVDPISNANLVLMNSIGYKNVVVVPPARPPDKNDDIFFLLFSRKEFGREFDKLIIGLIANLYQSISTKFNDAAPPCRMTFGVFPIGTKKSLYVAHQLN